MKVIGIILLVLQCVSLFGSAMNGSLPYLFSRGIPYLLGYFLPAIIGIFLLVKASNKESK